MDLDILSPKGQESLVHERRMLEIIRAAWKPWGIGLFETNKDVDSMCDGFVTKSEFVVGFYESKCRNLTTDQLKSFGSWLITAKKIGSCRQLSEQMKLPFMGFLYLIPEDKVLMWKITDEEGKYLFPMVLATTETQATINGGIANRVNAFLPFEYCQEIKII